MLSALRLQAARPGLARPWRGRLVVGVPAAVPRSGDGAGKPRPSLRRPKPRLPPLPADEAAEALEPGSPRQRQRAAGRPGSANALGGAALMGQIKDAKSSQQVVRLVQQAGQQCNAFHFTTAVNRVARLHQQRRSSSNQAAFAALLDIAEQHPAVLNHVAVAQTVYSGGVLQHRMTVQQQAAWQGRLVWALGHPKCEPQHVSNSLWGWCRMRLPLTGQLAAAADASIQRMAAQMNSQDVSNILLALATVGWQLSSAAAAALLQRLEQVLPRAEPQHVANSLWAIAKLGLQLSSSLEAAFVGALQRIIPAANSQNLANILLACGKLGWNPGEGILAAAVAAMQLLLAASKFEWQHIRNFLWGLAELEEQGATLPQLQPLLQAAAEWAACRWGQLAVLDVTDLCYNMERLGYRPNSAWIQGATDRCVECIAAKDVAGAYFGSFIAAVSQWDHQLQRTELEQLVPAAVDSICADWPDPGRGAALQAGNGLARQQALREGRSCRAACAALEGRLLPLLCSDFDLIFSGQLRPKIGELPYLASWASHLAAIGLCLPGQQLEALCSYVRPRLTQLLSNDRTDLQRAFKAWNYQPGLVLPAGPVAA